MSYVLYFKIVFSDLNNNLCMCPYPHKIPSQHFLVIIRRVLDYYPNLAQSCGDIACENLMLFPTAFSLVVLLIQHVSLHFCISSISFHVSLVNTVMPYTDYPCNLVWLINLNLNLNLLSRFTLSVW